MATPSRTIWTIGALLQWTTDFFNRKQIDEPRLSAELLLAHALGCSRMQLYTQYERVPEDAQLAPFREMVKQRAEHVPVAYLIGKAWFYSLEFVVSREVLIPRPDTETLVEQVITRVRQTPGWEPPAIVDLCTGSGCIAIALAKHLKTATIVAVDISAGALAVARKNAELHGVADRIEFLEGDLWSPVRELQPPRRFHVLVSNPPYIPTGEIADLMPSVRDHEPRLALDGGADGLDIHRRILEGVGEFVHAGGVLATEIAYNEGESAKALYESAAEVEGVRVVRDAAGQPRCVMATRKG